MSCRVARSQEWGARIIHEMESHPHSCFITLTYSDEYLPENRSVSKRELQLYVKRLRKAVEPREIKYFACGEYGTLNGRPHYHIIILGLRMNDPEIAKAWRKGNVFPGSLTIKSANYVAGYVQKKYSGALAAEVYGDRERPFQLQSNGIGREWAERNEESLIDDLSLTVRGQRRSMPRYYRKMLDAKISDESLDMRRIAMRNELEEFLVAREMSMDDAKQYLKDYRAQKNAELLNRIERYKARDF